VKIICAPDSFKESISATAAASAMADGILSVLPDAEIDRCPIGDGGEGTLAALLESGSGRLLKSQVAGPLGEMVDASIGMLGDGQVAFVESATAIGLPLIPADRRDVMRTTSYGVGELLLEAIAKQPAQIIVGVGGSATNDGGCGMAQALGVRFFDDQDKQIEQPISGDMLSVIARVDATLRNPALNDVSITVACDVTNPMTGASGAAQIYGPQKGASPAQVVELDAGLSNLAMLIRRDLGIEIEHVAGAGAGGGLGGGLVAFAGASIESGITTVLDAVNFHERVRDCDLCLTGEGRLDGQSVTGKACIGVAKAAALQGVRTIALVGSVGPGAEKSLAAGLDDYLLIGEGLPADESMRRAASLLTETASRLAHSLRNP
jgi:glycerate kinase